MREKGVLILKETLQLSRKEQKKRIDFCSDDFIIFLCECVLNVLQGTVPIKVETIRKYQPEFEYILRNRKNISNIRKVFTTPKGLDIVRLIGEPCIKYLES